MWFDIVVFGVRFLSRFGYFSTIMVGPDFLIEEHSLLLIGVVGMCYYFRRVQTNLLPPDHGHGTIRIE